ncbi:hypothetical protein BO78DRAFT_329012, partial [Aspergillus sclerotiicarbonarius CBS 121057]
MPSSDQVRQCLSNLPARLTYHLDTQNITPVFFTHKTRTIHMIDTPGFNNPNPTYSDESILTQITNHVITNQIRLSGIIYLHNISNPHMSDAAESNLAVIRKMCGESTLPALALATTFWDVWQDGKDRIDEYNKHKEQLKSDPRFWKGLVNGGCQIFDCDDGRSTALAPVEYFLERNQTVWLDIQEELVNRKLPLVETGAYIPILGARKRELERE